MPQLRLLPGGGCFFFLDSNGYISDSECCHVFSDSHGFNLDPDGFNSDPNGFDQDPNGFDSDPNMFAKM